MPQIVLGKTSKLPTRHFEVLSTKPHPASPFSGVGGSRTWVTLGRCTVCAQLWQADAWSRNVGHTSWPDLCIKMDTASGWEAFDDRPLRLAYFPEMVNGLAGNCSTPKCGGMAVDGLDTCANCACKVRYGVAALESRVFGAWSPAHPSPLLHSGKHVPLRLLLAVDRNNLTEGVKAFREAYPDTTLGEARDAFAQLAAQWPRGPDDQASGNDRSADPLSARTTSR